MNDLQKCQLDLLKAFVAVCEKHNLRYFLVAGSCLGAVRHQGFIPWDDDIDVGMPREDYDKYIELQKEYEGTKYFIQTYKTDPHYLYNFAKLRDSSTTYIENFYKTYQMNHGVWLDIFPLDGFSYELENGAKFAGKIKSTWRCARISYLWGLRRKFHKRTFFKDLLLNMVAILFFWTNVGHYRNKRLEKRQKKVPYAEAKTAGNWCALYYKKEAIDKSWFGEGTKAMFEGLEVVIPKEYDKYLKSLYNDYMQYPPEDKRVGHHINSGFSLTQGYEEYMKEHRM